MTLIVILYYNVGGLVDTSFPKKSIGWKYKDILSDTMDMKTAKYWLESIKSNKIKDFYVEQLEVIDKDKFYTINNRKINDRKDYYKDADMIIQTKS